LAPPSGPYDAPQFQWSHFGHRNLAHLHFFFIAKCVIHNFLSELPGKAILFSFLFFEKKNLWKKSVKPELQTAIIGDLDANFR
jgi:hypothetical protein